MAIPPIPAHVVVKTGPRILGYLFHFGLFGVLSMQVYLYYLAFSKDPARNKFFVYSVYILEVTQTLIITQSAYHVFGAGYGNFLYFDQVNTAWFSITVISGLVAFLAEVFYAYRISILADSYWVGGLIFAASQCTFSFPEFEVLNVIYLYSLPPFNVQLGGAIGSAVVLKQAKLFSRLLNLPFFITAGIWNGGSALCDIIISVCMFYYLWKRGSDAPKSTQVLLKRVVTLVIETGAVTATIAILNFVLILLPNHPSYFQTSSDVLAKIYSNSMMVVLNRRMKIRSEELSVPGVESTFRAARCSNVFVDTYEMQSRVVVINREHRIHRLGDQNTMEKVVEILPEV